MEVLRERLLTINPEAEITAIPENYYADGKTDSSVDLQLASYDFVIDAIDSVVAKTDLIINATRVRGMKVFSSMGAALRFDPTAVTTGELMSIDARLPHASDCRLRLHISLDGHQCAEN